MTKQTEALKMAIEQMQHLIKIYIPSPEWSGTAIQEDCYEIIQACKEALEQPAQEPYGWIYNERIDDTDHAIGYYYTEAFSYSEVDGGIPIYTHPAPSWQGLSDDEIDSVWFEVVKENNFEGTGKYFARAIETKLKEKNNAV